jgi:hypothetical protein
MTIEQDIAAIRRDQQAAQQRQATATAGRTRAEARAAATREDLQHEFGVSTVEEARAELAGLRQRLEAEAAEVRRQLDLAGGTA